MRVYELNSNQLNELKQNYYCEIESNVSWGEVANIDEIISDEEIFNAYAETDFCNDDFGVTAERNNKMKEYTVSVPLTLFTSFYINASSPEEAAKKLLLEHDWEDYSVKEDASYISDALCDFEKENVLVIDEQGDKITVNIDEIDE